MNKQKLEVLVLILVGVLSFGALFVLLMKYIIPVVAPFLIAWFVAFAVRVPAGWFAEKTHISERFWRPTLAISLTLFVFVSLALLFWQLTEFLIEVITEVTSGGELYIILARLSEPPTMILGPGIPDSLVESINEGIHELLSSVLGSLGSVITDVVSFVPGALFFLLITVISLVYFAIDLERINGFVKSLFPESMAKKLSSVRRNFFSVIGKYVKSYLQIMLITFAVMLIGFVALGIENAAIIAVIVSVLDLLPVLGVGIVLVPWSIFRFAVGDATVGIGLLIIFVLYTVIRELVEPKILGKSLDMHPIATLITVYVGYALFGFLGLIILPIATVLFGMLFKKDKAAEVDKR